MSAPPLAEIGPILDGASFYVSQKYYKLEIHVLIRQNPPEDISNAAETASTTGEELSLTVEE
jgi:hypothetical protein